VLGGRSLGDVSRSRARRRSPARTARSAILQIALYVVFALVMLAVVLPLATSYLTTSAQQHFLPSPSPAASR
jgi:hypothetical protein